MKKQWIWIFILLLCIGGVLYFIFKPSNTGEYDSSKIKIVNDNDDVNTDDSEQEESSNEKEEESSDDSNSESSVKTDFSSFSNDDQVVGEESESEFTLEEILDESKDDYHQITFKITSESEDDPYITAKYLSNLGVLRVDLNMLTTDKSGIAYQGERRVDVNGLSRIYHNISADETEEIYDIGLASSTVFKLESEKTSEGWDVILNIKYPGEASTDIDMGSEEYSSEDQNIVGSDKDDGASVIGYTYSVSGDVLSFVWTVSSNTSNPLPNVSASYNDENILVVSFDSLSVDKVVSSVNGLDMYGGINISSERSGDASVYSFNGIGGSNDFKLEGSTSPNQIKLNIKLK